MAAMQDVLSDASESPRLVHVDRLRFLASFDIVSTHALGYHLLAGVGLPIFLLTSVAMCVHRPVPPPLGRFLERRARGILVPWLFWSGVYGLWFAFLAWYSGRAWNEPFEAWMILYGTAVHLWFLPFILVANATAVGIARRLGGYPTRAAVLNATWIGVAVLLAAAVLRLHVTTQTPFPQWLFSIACIPLGLALGRTVSLGERRRKLLMVLAGVGVLLAAIGHARAAGPGIEWALLRRFGLALTLLSGAALWAHRTEPITQLLVRNSFGVCLVHPLLVSAARTWGATEGPPILQAAAVYAASLACTLALRRFGLGRFA